MNKKRSEVILEISEDMVKVSESSLRHDVWTIEKLGSKSVNGRREEDASDSISALFKELKISSKSVIVSIPRNQATIKAIKVPTHDPDELAKMAEYQAARQVPFSIDEIVVSHRIVEKESNGHTSALLVIVRRSLIEKYLKILTACGIHPQRICLTSEGLLNWYIASMPSLGDTGTKPLALIDVDSSSAEFQIIFRSKMEFSRSVSFKSAGGADSLPGQIKNSISSYYRSGRINAPLSKIWITGSPAKIKDLQQKIGDEVGVEAKEINTFEHIPMSSDLKSEISGLDNMASFVSIAGIGTDPDAMEVNLIPRVLLQAKRRESRKKDIAVTVFLSLCLLGMSALLIYRNIAGKMSRLKEITETISAAQPDAEKVEAMMKRLNAIREQLRGGASSIDVLYELYDIIPEGISVNIFLFDDKGTLALRGTSSLMSDVFDLIPKLEKSKYLTNVKVRYATKRKTKKGEYTDFEIDCLLEERLDI